VICWSAFDNIISNALSEKTQYNRVNQSRNCRKADFTFDNSSNSPFKTETDSRDLEQHWVTSQTEGKYASMLKSLNTFLATLCLTGRIDWKKEIHKSIKKWFWAERDVPE